MITYNSYAKSKIYKIFCPSENAPIYIGSTCKSLKTRLAVHRNYFEDKYTTNKGRYSSAVVFEYAKEHDLPVHIELLEQYPCQTRKELCIREGYYQRLLGCCNIRIAGGKRRKHKL